MARKALNLKKLPYATTSISINKTKGDIDKMLRKAGADGVQWSELYRPERKAEICFIKDEKMYKLSIPINVEDLEKERKNIAPSRYDQYLNQRERSMYRAMFHYIESLIKAQDHGLISFEEAFVGHAKVYLPGGEESTVSEVILSHKLDISKALNPAKNGSDAVDVTPIGRLKEKP